MKIAFIVSQFPAISETFILRQITGLLDRGHEVDIFAHHRPTDSTVQGDVDKYKLLERTRYIDIYASSNKLARLAKRVVLLLTNFHKHPRAILSSLNLLKFGKKAILLQVFNQILPFLDKGPYDIVHCHFGPNGELGLLLKDLGLFHKKLITTFYGYDISSHLKYSGDHVYHDLFNRGDLFLCVSERMREKLISLGCDERKVKVLRLGIDTKRFRVPRREAKKDEGVRILTVARLVEKKGVAYGIRAVANLVKKYPHLEYQIVGDGYLRDKLHGLIEKLKVAGHIKLVGWKRQEEVMNLLESSDLLLAPSVASKNGDEEGIPVVIIEALGGGLPVVSTYHAGIPEVVEDGQSGFLVPERDVEALAKKLQAFIEQPALRSEMGRKGRKFVEEHYEIEALNNRLARIYERLLGRGSAMIVAFAGSAMIVVFAVLLPIQQRPYYPNLIGRGLHAYFKAGLVRPKTLGDSVSPAESFASSK